MRNRSKLGLILGVGLLLLAACTEGSIFNPSTPERTVYAARSAYSAAFLAPAAAYNELPRCPQPTPVCSEASVVQRLRQVDDTAKGLLDDAEAIVRGQKKGDAAAAQKAAQDAVDAAVGVLQTYNIKGGA